MENRELLSSIKAKFAGINELPGDEGLLTLAVPAGSLYNVCTELKVNHELDFDYVMCISGVDLKDKMQVVYHLYSMNNKHKVALKAELDRSSPEITSVAPLWQAADWHEREAFDMFGIVFKGHPNLTRILTEEGFIGYPLRKDYVGKPDQYD